MKTRIENKIIISWFDTNLCNENDNMMFNEIEEILEKYGYIYNFCLDDEQSSKEYIKIKEERKNEK